MRALLITLLAAGCFSPDIGEGALVCGDNNLCPEGFSCAGGHCYQNPPAIDAPAIDAAGSCTPGIFERCESSDGGADDLIHCSSDGTHSETTACDFGCNATAGQCNVCSPSATSCDAQGRLLSCSSDGLAQSRMPCMSDSNECTDDLCVGGGCVHRNITDGVSCSSAPGGAMGACLAGVCVCGDMGEPCCNGTCNGGLSCIGNSCGSCGSMGQPCCTGGGQTCGPGFICTSNMCTACGRDGEPCCSGSMCDSGNNCVNSTCHACGAVNQTCCTAVPICSGTLGCVQNTCQCIPDCNGKACGADDGCGHPCQTGSCTSGKHCVSGQCVCDMVSCSSGCCNAQGCQQGNTTAACGSGGRMCQTCGGLALCVGGNCQL